MTEKEKAAAGMMYDGNYEPVMAQERARCKDVCFRFNSTDPSQRELRAEMLKKLFGKAVPLAVSLIGSFLGYVHGENDFPEEFSETFSHRRGWKEIPVLSAEEERAYTV